MNEHVTPEDDGDDGDGDNDGSHLDQGDDLGPDDSDGDDENAWSAMYCFHINGPGNEDDDGEE